MNTTSTDVQSHYANNEIVARLLGALEAAGLTIDPLSVEDLLKADQLHGGGLNATVRMAECAGVRKGMRVLDAGSGVGGAARYLAHAFDCSVDGIDLTPHFVEAAVDLTQRVGLEGQITYRQGSVTDVPFEADEFDLVWCQNVSMNIEDKAALFGEAFRVLKPGGTYVLSHAAQGPAGEPYYPLPWAREPHYSFLGTPEEFLEGLDAAGFSDITDHRAGGAPATSAKPNHPTLGTGAVMGDDMPERSKNSSRSSEEGRLVGMLVTARKPG